MQSFDKHNTRKIKGIRINSMFYQSNIFFYTPLTKKEDSKACFECHFAMDKFLHVCCNRDPNCKFPQKKKFPQLFKQVIFVRI